MRNIILIFASMSKDVTGTYQLAKDAYNRLSVNKKVYYQLDKTHSQLFRKHLLEMVKRKNSGEKYVTRCDGLQLMVMRIE